MICKYGYNKEKIEGENGFILTMWYVNHSKVIGRLLLYTVLY